MKMFVTFDPVCDTYVRRITLVGQYFVVDYTTSSVADVCKSDSVMAIAKQCARFYLGFRLRARIPNSLGSKNNERQLRVEVS